MFPQSALPIILWVLSLGSHARQFLALVGAIRDAKNVREGGDALKRLVDFTVPLLEEFPIPDATMAMAEGETLESKVSELASVGVDAAALKDLLPIIQLLMPILLDWLKKRSGGASALSSGGQFDVTAWLEGEALKVS